jgi:hypothetical protein
MMLCNCKIRAREKGVPFALKKDDIIVPDTCPVFGISFRIGCDPCNRNFVNSYAPSIDRIDGSKGYVKDNIVVVSCRANSIKGNATPEELLKVAHFYSQFIK